jgi:hypothetical protein
MVFGQGSRLVLGSQIVPVGVRVVVDDRHIPFENLFLPFLVATCKYLTTDFLSLIDASSNDGIRQTDCGALQAPPFVQYLPNVLTHALHIHRQTPAASMKELDNVDLKCARLPLKGRTRRPSES